MIREILKASSDTHVITIPKEYLGKVIEILVLPFDTSQSIKPQENDDVITVLKNTTGILKDKNIDASQWQKTIRQEYETLKFKNN